MQTIINNLENYKSWNGKVYNNAIYVKGEKVTDTNRIDAYKQTAKIVAEMMEYFKDETDPAFCSYIVLNKELIAVTFVSEAGVSETPDFKAGYMIAGILKDEYNRKAERSNTPEKMAAYIVRNFLA